MHVKAKKTAIAGLLLAFTIVCIAMGSVIETNTLFLLAAASYFVGIIYREFGGKMGAAFYICLLYTSQSNRAADHTGNYLRRPDCIYHVH